MDAAEAKLISERLVLKSFKHILDPIHDEINTAASVGHFSTKHTLFGYSDTFYVSVLPILEDYFRRKGYVVTSYTHYRVDKKKHSADITISWTHHQIASKKSESALEEFQLIAKFEKLGKQISELEIANEKLRKECKIHKREVTDMERLTSQR